MKYSQLRNPNLDPVIYSGKTALTSWAGWCLAYVEVAFDTPRLYASAWRGWLDAQRRRTNRDFPKDVYFPIWFSHTGSYGQPPTYDNWGHVVIAKVAADGSMTIWSSPRTAKTFADTYHSIEEVERIYRSTFVGWSEDIARVNVIEPLQEDDMTLDEYAADILDVIEDNPWYAESKPDAFRGHVAWLNANNSWEKRREWVKGIMANNGVLNATYMREHLAADQQVLNQNSQLGAQVESQGQMIDGLQTEDEAQIKAIEQMSQTLNRQKQELVDATTTIDMLRAAAKSGDLVSVLSGFELIRLGIRKWLGIDHPSSQLKEVKSSHD